MINWLWIQKSINFIDKGKYLLAYAQEEQSYIILYIINMMI